MTIPEKVLDLFDEPALAHLYRLTVAIVWVSSSGRL